MSAAEARWRTTVSALQCDDVGTGVNDEIAVPLTDDERELLRCGLGEWGGPARCTDRMAVAMGFESVQDLLVQADRLRVALASKLPLTQRDWMRTLLATELADVAV